VSRELDALFGREGARDNSHPYDSWRGRLPSIPHVDWVQTRTLDSLGNHGGTDRGLPDRSERVESKRIRLLWLKVWFGARRFDPDIGARTSNQAGLGGEAVVEVLGLDRRRRVWSSRNPNRESVAGQMRIARLGRELGSLGAAIATRGGARHWGKRIRK